MKLTREHPEESSWRVKILISYSHADESFRSSLVKHLKVLERTSEVEIWDDRSINAGTPWESEIDTRIEKSDIVLALVSPDFVSSNYCYEKEMKRALERHERGRATVIPIIVRACYWEPTPLGKLQALPRDLKPVEEWEHPDQAWENVVRGIAEIVLANLKRRARERLDAQMMVLMERAMHDMLLLPIRNLRDQ